MSRRPSRLAGAILAAGYSSRMGSSKPLLEIGGVAALTRAAAALRGGGVDELVVVTGYGREPISKLIAGCGAVEAWNERFCEGMFTSVQAGLSKAAEICGREAACLLLPSDCPMVSARTVDKLIVCREKRPDCFIVPCYRGKKGHPLLIPPIFAREILEYGGDGGLKAISRRHEDMTLRLETGDEGVVLDMDTPDSYAEILAYYESVKDLPDGASPPDELKNFTGALFIVRHGEIEAHAEKIFLGQTDTPLSKEGREQAFCAARRLVEYGAGIKILYTSDLKRAAETARIITEYLNRAGDSVSVREDARLRELDLGNWDGRFIREIKELYPEEYARRGTGLLGWKASGGENFYDLRYRALKGLRAALRDAGPDAAIVSHSGVIRVIMAELAGVEIETAAAFPAPRGGVIKLEIENGRIRGRQV